MSFGEFAGGFAEAFQNSYMAQQNRKRQDQIAKQQAKLIEMQLQSGQVKLDAQTTIADLMAGMPARSQQVGQQADVLGQQIQQEQANPQMPLGEIDIDVQQPRAPMGLTEMLADPTGSMALVNAGYLDVGDLLDFKQTEMIQGGMPDFNSLFSQFMPGGDGGFDPQTSPYIPEMSVGPQGPTITFKRNPDHVTTQQRQTDVKGIEKYYSQALEAVDLLAEIEGTTFQSGNPLGDLWRSIGEGGSAFGLPFFTDEDQEQLRDKRGRLDKLLATFQINSEERTALTQTARGQQVLDLVESASASLENGAVPNAQVIADMLEAKLVAADIMGNPVNGRQEMESFIGTVRAAAEQGVIPGMDPAAEQPNFEVPVEAVQQMTIEQLNMLREAIDQGAEVSQEAIQAARARWLELNNGR